MLRLLIDTSTLLDLAKRRDGQEWIVSLPVFAHQGKLELLVPTVVIDEFKRNRARVETSMTASVSERFRLIKRDLDEYGGEDQQHALDVLEGLAHFPADSDDPLPGIGDERSSPRQRRMPGAPATVARRAAVAPEETPDDHVQP